MEKPNTIYEQKEFSTCDNCGNIIYEFDKYYEAEYKLGVLVFCSECCSEKEAEF